MVDISVETDERLKGTVRSFLEALECVEALYHLENTGAFSPTLENAVFQKIIQTLKKGGLYLSTEEKFDLEEEIDLMAQGIHDLSSVTLKHDGKDYIELILGRVFSLDKTKRVCYSGAVGVVNKSFDDLIQAYDRKLDLFLEKLPISRGHKGFSIKESAPLMRCIDVFSLAGELNIRHKPICVFFSGGGSSSLSALSRMTVFINVYVRRFELISREIARAYMEDYPIIKDLNYESIGRFLLLWLRGHDVGHFYGEDSLRERMSELDKVYLILHELKSDMVALYNLRHLSDDLLRGDLLVKAYVTSIAEMFRYIRRGKFSNYPDTASAFLTYSYFKENGSIRFNPKGKKFRVDFDKLEKDIENLTGEVFRIFAEGDESSAREFVNRWGDMEGLGRSDLPDELKVLEDTKIPYYVDFNFITRDEILLGLLK